MIPSIDPTVIKEKMDLVMFNAKYAWCIGDNKACGEYVNEFSYLAHWQVESNVR